MSNTNFEIPGAGVASTSLSSLPVGVNPQTHRFEEVTELLKKAAYFPLFSIPNPASPNEAALLIPNVPLFITEVSVNEQLHRFEVNVADPSVTGGVQATDHVGEPVARVHIRWTPIYDNYEPSHDRQPPPAILNPFASQRFTMLDGHFSFDVNDGSGFLGFGAGRTFPALQEGLGVLRIGAAIEVLEGLGQFRGHDGAVVVNGEIQPPAGLALNILARIMDPEETLKATAPLTPIQEIPDPDPTAVFMFFLAEPDPEQPITLKYDSTGQIVGYGLNERLRLVEIGYNVAQPTTIASSTEEGPIIGSVSGTLLLNPLNTADVFPIQTNDTVFTFTALDDASQVIGTIKADMVEGRAFKTDLEDLPSLHRMVGFGPIIEGTGAFSTADGMMSTNGVVSAFPSTISNLYVFRFFDPQYKLHQSLSSAGYQ
jgi:hypothetical protein